MTAALSSHRGLLSVVVPAFNEAAQIQRCVEETTAALDELGVAYEIVIVDDGSDDGTADLARAAAAGQPRVRVTGHDVNLGKGSALIRGTATALGDLVLFVDADLEVHPRQVALLYEELLARRLDVVIGSKLHPDSQLDYPRSRRLLSVGYYLLVRLLFRLPVRDTQTGLKLYRADALRRVAPRLVVKRFAHDLEVLVIMRRLGYRIGEAPVVVTRARPFPRIGAPDIHRVAHDTAAIWYRTYVLRHYDRVGARIDTLLELTPRLDPEELERLLGAAGSAELDGLAAVPGVDDGEREAKSP